MPFRIALMSDLHLECAQYIPPAFEADACILAGDISEAAAGSPVLWAQSHIPSHIPTVFVPGNHDFFGGRVEALLASWRKQSKGSHVHVLYNNTLRVGGVDILGTPLWSDLQNSASLIQLAHLKKILPQNVPDFSQMHTRYGRTWTVAKMLDEARKSQQFLSKALHAPSSRAKVVVTHWAPLPQSVTPGFKGDLLNPYFLNDLPELVQQAQLWVHGHVHSKHDYRVGPDPARGRVVCHPRGTPKMGRIAPYAPRIIELDVD